MHSDQQLRLRADQVRKQLEVTLHISAIAIEAATELVADCQKRRESMESQVATSADHIRVSRETLARQHPNGINLINRL